MTDLYVNLYKKKKKVPQPIGDTANVEANAKATVQNTLTTVKTLLMLKMLIIIQKLCLHLGFWFENYHRFYIYSQQYLRSNTKQHYEVSTNASHMCLLANANGYSLNTGCRSSDAKTADNH